MFEGRQQAEAIYISVCRAISDSFQQHHKTIRLPVLAPAVHAPKHGVIWISSIVH